MSDKWVMKGGLAAAGKEAALEAAGMVEAGEVDMAAGMGTETGRM